MADGPPLKKRKTSSESQCVRCNIYIRKTPGAHLVIKSREEAEQTSADYDIYIQNGDIICSKCRSQLRKIKSVKAIQNEASSSTADLERNSSLQLGQLEQEIREVDLQKQQQSKSPVQSTSHCEMARQIIYESNPNSQLSNQTNSQTTLGSQTNSQTTYTSSGSEYIVASPVKVETVEMPFFVTCSSHGYCFICKSKTNLRDVPFHARIQVFTKRRIFIPRRNRCCTSHLIKNRFYMDEVNKIFPFSHGCSIEVPELKKFIDGLSDKVDTNLHEHIGEYELTEERLRVLTGHTWDQISQLRSMLTSMRNSEVRTVTQALVIFLLKLRTGNSDSCIAAILGLEENQVNSSINAVLKSFKEDILPTNFGFRAHSREFYIDHAAAAAKRLHNLDDRLAVICDASYLRHQKSSNNTYQRKSYSGQKKTSLCKPFTICTTDGFVIDVPGPFPANKNDAQILEHLLQIPDGISTLLKPGDVFILDRGFRDVKQLLEERGYTVLMPALKGQRNQLTTEESNASRLVTKIRWVVEAIHGILGQKYKLLHHQMHNGLLHNADLFCQIACFLQNTFGKRLNSDSGLLDPIIDRILSLKDTLNTLALEVEENNWNRKSLPFQVVSSDNLWDFPELTLEELKILFTGSYQLSQSVSYLAEMLDENDSFSLSYAKEQTDIIRFEVRSRHINSKTYKCYIQYVEHGNGLDAIKRYCCSCANGNRTIGCCSHVASIIYYLSYARFLSKIIRPAEVLTKLFDFEEIDPIIEEDSEVED